MQSDVVANKKLKVMVLADSIFSSSGVGHQTRVMVEGLLKTGRYSFLQLGGAIRHQDYTPSKTKEWGDDLIVVPVDGYGTQEKVLSLMQEYKPDVMWIMTDPRFWTWLWNFEHVVRSKIPIVYYHVWDNYPYPKFNKKFYMSNDKIVSISKLTSDIVKTVAPEVDEEYLPHAVDPSIFKVLDEKDYSALIQSSKTFFFWTNRNARRKLSGSVVWWFKEFLDVVGHDKAFLLMHTDPKDPNGQDLEAIAKELGLTRTNFGLSTDKVAPQIMATFYNAADCTINISDAEGFGLALVESLSCGTPVIATKTGGMADQATDGKNVFGVLIEPASKAVIGSQDTPYIYEDRVSGKDVVAAMLKIHNMSREERKSLGNLGRQYVLDNFSFDGYIKSWDRIFQEVYEKHGSWDTRKNFKAWTIKEY